MPTNQGTPGEEEFRKGERLRLSIEAGIAALERGDYTEVEDECLDCYLANLLQPHDRQTHTAVTGPLSARTRNLRRT